jgi:hypothetical protein
VLGIDAQFWLNRETFYREKLSRIEQEEFLQQCVEWLKEQPTKELKQMGYLKADKTGPALVEDLLRFYSVYSPEEWRSIYVENYASADFKRSFKYRISFSAMAAFLRIGEIEVRKMQLPEFDKNSFKSNLQQIRELAQNHPEDFAQQLKRLCLEAGVALIYCKSFPGAPVSGVVRWIGGNPVIQLTDRYKMNDAFWSAFFHEAGHIFLHGKKDVFIESFEGVVIDEKKEEEADHFSDEWLIPSQFLKSVSSKITEKEIKQLARQIGIHPGIVVGRLQKMKILDYNQGTNLKLKVFLDQEINPANK